MSEDKKAEYRAALEAMTDDELARAAEMKVWLYQRGWNEAYRSCGYEPSEAEREAARPPA